TASAELLRLGGVAYPALKAAAKSRDGQLKHQVNELIGEIETTMQEQPSRTSHEDFIVTATSTIAGRIEAKDLRAYSPIFGDVRLRLTDLRKIRALDIQPRIVALLESVREQVSAGHLTRSRHLGSGDQAYQDVPRDGALLVGFEVTFSGSG